MWMGSAQAGSFANHSTYASGPCSAHSSGAGIVRFEHGVVVNVPYFIFPVVKVVWVDGQRGNKSSYVDSAEASAEMSESKLNTRMPFQHPAISKLIYEFWFSGQMQAEVNAWREKFSIVPDNLIALVCNALEAALKDHLQASAGNALDLQFSNKIYAPKWDDLMTLLEGIQSLSPAGYQSMKTVIWGRKK
ncbi:hypothetical protein C8Q72DRAFT_883853 [Fomitopsis betulina]|nr:hypothetical protein C8Q72DRAFT_883853 [Fomitopsis betulina]